MSGPGLDWDEARRQAERLRRLEEVQRGLEQLGAHEVIVVGAVVQALIRGAAEYGNLDIWMDVRDFEEEAREEALDDLIYRAIHWLREGSG